jgi:putative NADH-flavin reductase
MNKAGVASKMAKNCARGDMRLLVLGATGGVGMELVRQAVERGHAVTAFVRSPERLSPFAGRISVHRGNLLASAELARVMQGHEAILSGFGPRLPIAKSDAHLLRDFAVALAGALDETHVQRALVVSTAFLFKDAMIPPAHLIGRLFFSGVVADATAMEAVLENSRHDITVVRPPQLTDKPHTGKFRVREGRLPRFGFSISRADLADCILRIAEAGNFRKAVVGVST